MNTATCLQIQKWIYQSLYGLDLEWEAKQDIAQDTIIKILQRRPENIRGFAKKVAINAAIDYLRHRCVHASLFELNCNQSLEDVEVRDYLIDRLEQTEQLKSVVQNLSSDHKLVLGLHYCQGLKYDEIAAQLQIPLGTVRSRLGYARKYLKEALEAA